MIKQTPSLGKLAGMAVFALSCFGILLFLWLSFGGSIPLKPESYRFKAAFPEAATLAAEADVRMAGVDVGKVKTKELDKGAARTIVEVELDSKFAPIPTDTRAILRQKTLLGETYIELAQGTKAAGMLDDGGTLARSNVEPAVELDEIFGIFDPETRRAFRAWVNGTARAIEGGTGEDLNDALGNLEGFAVDGADLLGVLDEQGRAVRQLVRNTGRVFAAINEREGALRGLIVNSNRTFEATASRDQALAETIRIFPTFEDESRLTLARLNRFARNTHPLVNDLKPVADDLGPTVRDLGDLSPHLVRLFRDTDALIRVSRTGLPAAQRFIAGLEPVVEALHVFVPELNPLLAYLNFEQTTIGQFFSEGAAGLAGEEEARPEGSLPTPDENYLPQIATIDNRSLARYTVRPEYDRGNAYFAPNYFTRAGPLGTVESFECRPSGGEEQNPREDIAGNPGANGDQPSNHQAPPCFVQPASLFGPLPGGASFRMFPSLVDLDETGELTPILGRLTQLFPPRNFRNAGLAPGPDSRAGTERPVPCANPNAFGLCP